MRTTGEPEKGGKVRSQCVTFHLFSTNDHHTKEATDNDHDLSPSDNSITIGSQTTPTTANATTPKVYKQTQRLPKPLTNNDRHHDARWGQMPTNDTNCPPSRPTNDDGHRKHQQRPHHHHARSTTATTTPSYEDCSPPPATKPPSDYRTTDHPQPKPADQ